MINLLNKVKITIDTPEVAGSLRLAAAVAQVMFRNLLLIYLILLILSALTSLIGRETLNALLIVIVVVGAARLLLPTLPAEPARAPHMLYWAVILILAEIT